MRGLPRCAGLAVWLAILSGCGYIGDPLPPALNIPMTIPDLTVLQRGDKIYMRFTLPDRSTEDLPLTPPPTADLRVGPAGPEPFDVNQWAETARKIPAPASPDAAILAEVPATEWAGQDVVVAVRAIGAQGKASSWSNVAIVAVVPPLSAAASVKTVPQPGAMEISWEDPAPVAGAVWRIFRKSDQEEAALLAGTAAQSPWSDPNVSFGRTYTYWVQRVFETGRGAAESDLSPPVEAAYKDAFPPGRPKAVTVIQGIGAVELAWERNTEADLAGYHVYRAEGDGEFVRLNGVLTVPAATDKTAQAGKRYRYRITAADQLGNEGQPSEPVEITAQ